MSCMKPQATIDRMNKQREWGIKLGRYVSSSEIHRLENPEAYPGMKLPEIHTADQLR